MNQTQTINEASLIAFSLECIINIAKTFNVKIFMSKHFWGHLKLTLTQNIYQYLDLQSD